MWQLFTCGIPVEAVTCHFALILVAMCYVLILVTEVDGVMGLMLYTE